MLKIYVTTRLRMQSLYTELADDRGSDATEKAQMIAIGLAIATVVGVAAKIFIEKLTHWG